MREMRADEDDSQISLSDDDDDDFRRPDQFAQEPGLGTSFNETQASFKLKNDFDEDNLNEVRPIIRRFYKEELKKNHPSIQLQKDSKIFGLKKEDIIAQQPIPNLFFLPTVILLPPQTQLVSIRNRIVNEYPNCNVGFKTKKRDVLEVQIQQKGEYALYIIKILPLTFSEGKYQHPEFLDSSIILDPLLNHYVLNYDSEVGILETISLVFYWAHQKDLLHDDYVSADILKLLLICFFCTLSIGITNIVFNFAEDPSKKEQLHQFKKMYKVNKKLDCVLDKELFEETNFTVIQTKGFYVPSKRKYTSVKKIIPIPYPINETDQKKFQDKTFKRDFKPKKNQKGLPLLHFFKFLYYLNGFMKQNKHYIVDLKRLKFGFSLDDKTNRFMLSVIHPVFQNNLSQHLLEDFMRMDRLQKEINQVIEVYQDCGEAGEALKKILRKNR